LWEEWDLSAASSEIGAACSPDLGQHWAYWLDVSQTPSTRSVRPGLAYQKGHTFRGPIDACWTEPAADPPARLWFLNATRLADWIAQSVPGAATAPPKVLRFARAVPDPFTQRVVFEIDVAGAGKVTLAIHDAQGRRVRTLVRDAAGPGRLRVTWGGADDGGQPVPAGVYFARAGWGTHRAHRRVVLIR
jgi:hypothetical protein